MIITLRRLENVAFRVQTELNRWGIYTRKLQRVDCLLTYHPSLGGELAYFVTRADKIYTALGLQEGHIYFPWLIARHCLADILRHEYGHAWAYCHPAQFESKRFADAFGARYSSSKSFLNHYCEEDFITEYAATNPSEDFCDSFAAFLKMNGKIDRFKSRRGVYQKLKTVGEIIRRSS